MLPVPKPLKTTGWIAIHVWIVFHFAAVIIAPASVPPASRLAQNAWSYCGGYLQVLFLNHGYHFFAPDPGGSTLIAYEAKLPDGTTQWNRIPNREIWPRLNYHRHFMLTEHMAVTAAIEPELEPLLAKTYASEIARQTGATDVVLYRVEHELSSPEQVRAGRYLDDPVTYVQTKMGKFSFPSHERVTLNSSTAQNSYMGQDAESRNSESRNSESRNSESRNTESRNTESQNAEISQLANVP